MSDKAFDEGDAIRKWLLCAYLPLWFVPGVMDYFHHRKSAIERTSGARESLTHLAMFGVVGAPISLALFFEVDGFILGGSAFAAFLHEVLTVYDVAYANARRETSPAEQHVHSFLEVMPLVGAFLLAGTHPNAVADLRANPRSILRPKLARKRVPVPREYLIAFFAAVCAFIIAPYAEEFVRCYRCNPTLDELPTSQERSEDR